MKITRKEKEKRAKRFNISTSTYYSWEKNKEELIKIIELGLQKEKEILNENGEDIMVTLKKLEERLNMLEKVKDITEN